MASTIRIIRNVHCPGNANSTKQLMTRFLTTFDAWQFGFYLRNKFTQVTEITAAFSYLFYRRQGLSCWIDMSGKNGEKKITK